MDTQGGVRELLPICRNNFTATHRAAPATPVASGKLSQGLYSPASLVNKHEIPEPGEIGASLRVGRGAVADVALDDRLPRTVISLENRDRGRASHEVSGRRVADEQASS